MKRIVNNQVQVLDKRSGAIQADLFHIGIDEWPGTDHLVCVDETPHLSDNSCLLEPHIRNGENKGNGRTVEMGKMIHSVLVVLPIQYQLESWEGWLCRKDDVMVVCK